MIDRWQQVVQAIIAAAAEGTDSGGSDAPDGAITIIGQSGKRALHHEER